LRLVLRETFLQGFRPVSAAPPQLGLIDDRPMSDTSGQTGSDRPPIIQARPILP
jgi:hypothetical protein